MFNDANPAGHRSPNHGHAKGNDDDHHDKQILQENKYYRKTNTTGKQIPQEHYRNSVDNVNVNSSGLIYFTTIGHLTVSNESHSGGKQNSSNHK